MYEHLRASQVLFHLKKSQKVLWNDTSFTLNKSGLVYFSMAFAKHTQFLVKLRKEINKYETICSKTY